MKHSELIKIVKESSPNDWEVSADHSIFSYKNNLDITLIVKHLDIDFYESWATQHPDNSSKQVLVTLRYSNNPIKDFYMATVDGGRATIPYPKSNDELIVNQLDYKVAQIIEQNNTQFEEYFFKRCRMTVND